MQRLSTTRGLNHLIISIVILVLAEKLTNLCVPRQVEAVDWLMVTVMEIGRGVVVVGGGEGDYIMVEQRHLCQSMCVHALTTCRPQ